jgi:hypothetical protein
VEYPEAWYAQNNEADEGVEYAEGILKELDGAVENPKSEYSTAYNNGAIDDKNAPIWQ